MWWSARSSKQQSAGVPNLCDDDDDDNIYDDTANLCDHNLCANANAIAKNLF